jgi:phosphate transport system permease protein
MESAYLPAEEPTPPLLSRDQRAELLLGALVCGVVLLILAMLTFILKEAWPSFWHNGLAWFGAGGNFDNQLSALVTAGENNKSAWTIHTWDLLYSTVLTTAIAVVLAFVFSLFAAVFMVEFAPPAIRRILEPVVRLLAGVPSVIYGLIGVYVLVPFIGHHLITKSQQASVTPVISLTGYSLLAAVLILTVMISPIMIAIFAEGLRSVPRSWLEGSLALGVNRWQTFWNIGVRTARPALVAGTVLATARALGEAVTLGMVSGETAFAPNPVDGLIFWYEPTRPYAATILGNNDGFALAPVKHALFAIGAVLLFSSALLSIAGYAAKQPMRQFFNVGGVE